MVGLIGGRGLGTGPALSLSKGSWGIGVRGRGSFSDRNDSKRGVDRKRRPEKESRPLGATRRERNFSTGSRNSGDASPRITSSAIQSDAAAQSDGRREMVPSARRRHVSGRENYSGGWPPIVSHVRAKRGALPRRQSEAGRCGPALPAIASAPGHRGSRRPPRGTASAGGI